MGFNTQSDLCCSHRHELRIGNSEGYLNLKSVGPANSDIPGNDVSATM
jgi:hypothetical protein